MNDEKALIDGHPMGEPFPAGIEAPETDGSVDTFAGRIQVKWLPGTAVSSLVQMPFCIEFLKTCEQFD